MKNTIVAVLTVLATFSGFAQSSFVYFDTDDYSLSQDAKTQLNALIQKIKQQPIASDIGIIGHTDADASHAYNKLLSLKRARAVKTYLENAGLYRRFHLISRGETQLVNANTTALEKAKNRRVEIQVNFETPNQVYEALEKPYQEFKIPTDVDTLITCLQGTLLHIDKHSFALVNDSLELTLKVKEYYNTSEFIRGRLSTATTEGLMLESRGMVDIRAYQNNEEVPLKDGKTLGINFKDRTVNDSTLLFNGEKHGDEVVWSTDNLQNEIGESFLSGSVYWLSNDDTIYRKEWREETIGNEVFKIQTIVEDGKTTIDTIPLRSEQLMKSLVLRTQDLGWINCDRFYQSNAPKTDLIVKIHENFVPNVSLVFSEINAILPYSYREDDTLIFKNVPTGMKVTLVGLYKKDAHAPIYAAKKSSITKVNSKEVLNFKMVSEETLDRYLEF